MTVDTSVHLSALTADSEAFAQCAAGHLDQPVPSCPGWAVADLVGHLGGVYSWVKMVVDAAGARPGSDRDGPPPERDQLVEWFADRRDAMVEALTGREPSSSAWIFAAPHTGDIGWWRRRQALETAVHLYDVQSATSTPAAVAPELAADGVDEVLTVFLPRFLARRDVPGLEGSVHLHCTDTDGEWVVEFGGSEPEVRREHAKADTALRGPASDLFLLLWNRVTLDGAGLEVFGNRRVAEALSDVRL